MAAAGLFEPVCRHAKTPSHPRADALVALARSLHAQGLTPSYGPGDHGNLSVRTPAGCLITARETHKSTLRTDELAAVVGTERHGTRVRLIYDGACPPSTDALMHLELYAARPEIAGIVHGHDDRILAQAPALGLPMTRISAKSNSLTLVEEMTTLCARHDYVIMREHGFVALGRTLEAAEACVQQWYQRARTT